MCVTLYYGLPIKVRCGIGIDHNTCHAPFYEKVVDEVVLGVIKEVQFVDFYRTFPGYLFRVASSPAK